MHVEVIVERGEPLGRRTVIRPGQRFEVGRSAVSVMLLGDTTVSRRHALIEVKADGTFLVADLNSRNGTYVAGQRLQPYLPTRVAPGATISVGNHELRINMCGLDDDTRHAVAEGLKSDLPFLPGEEIEILGVIGSGAHGRVYAAYQKLMDRRVAVKFLHRRGEAEQWERFLQEGRLACRVRSPFVVEVYDFRLAADRIYLLMELVDGVTLKDRLAQSWRPSIPEALHTAADVARGLSAVHLEGVIHRDIKPSNILLSPSGVAKLSDFGIAKDLWASEDMTPDGAGFGSFPYVSPEQATRAVSVDTRADIYSLGATLYHLIAGRPPFKATGDVLKDVTEQRPCPLQDLNPLCPPDVARLVEAMLHKIPAARPPTADSVARQLTELRVLLYPEFSPRAQAHERARITQTDRFYAVSSNVPQEPEPAAPEEEPRRPNTWGAAGILEEDASPVAPIG